MFPFPFPLGLGGVSCRRTRDVWKGRRAPAGVRNLAVRRRELFVNRVAQNWVAWGEVVVVDLVVEMVLVQSLGLVVFLVVGVSILFPVDSVMLLSSPPLPSRASNAPRPVRSMVMVCDVVGRV